MFEEEETTEAKDKGGWEEEAEESKWAAGNRESPVFPCISFLDDCLPDDRIRVF